MGNFFNNGLMYLIYSNSRAVFGPALGSGKLWGVDGVLMEEGEEGAWLVHTGAVILGKIMWASGTKGGLTL
jgi:hypothetical protein